MKIIPIILFFWISTEAQNQYRNWYFSKGIGLDFALSPPQVVSGSAMNDYVGCSTMSDSEGNLLFYTDAATIWNRNHQVMVNGDGLIQGALEVAQAGLIVKQPSADVYYVFTTTHGLQPYDHTVLRYTIVNMAQDAGLGGVTVKNQTLSLQATWKFTAADHADGQKMWVIMQARHNVFKAYLLSASGLSLNAVASSTMPASPNSDNIGQIGVMKISPNGRKLAVSTGEGVELYDFDNSTGIISNQIRLATIKTATGIEFSADNSKLYCGRGDGAGKLYQWNLCAESERLIQASLYTIDMEDYVHSGALQMGIDGKIYVGRWQKQYMGVINSPDSVGTSCNYVDEAIYLGGKFNAWLPNYPQFNFLTSSKRLCNGELVSVNEKIGAESISIYPNPSSGKLTLKGYKGRVSVINTMGRTVLVKDLTDSYSLDLTDQPKGLYTVRIGTSCVKVVLY